MPDSFEKFAGEIQRGLAEDKASVPFGPFVTQEWEVPIPFNASNLPNFPIEKLPGPLSGFVECLAESTQTAEEMGGVLSLGILATAFQSKFEVEITPDWREPLCLYTVAVASPGERKSAVISALTKPIFEYEAEQRELEAVEIAQNQTERLLLEKALQAAQNSAVKGKGSNFEAKRQEALDLSAQIAQFRDKHPFRLLTDDSTTEKLIDLMDSQDGCMTVCSAEGGIFDAMTGRYDKTGNFDVYLKGHAGDPIVVDRIGRKTNNIPNPRLSMLLTIQPEVLTGLMSNTTFRGRGLCGRFLYVICQSKVGHREVAPPPMPGNIRTDYRTFVRKILSMPYTGTIHLSPEADALRQDYQGYIEQKLGDEWDSMRDWGGKLVGAMIRIAAMMHAAQAQGNPVDSPIGTETMSAAIGIADFLSAHAVAAYQAMGADSSYEDAKYLWRRIDENGLEETTKRDLYRLCKGKFRCVGDMEPALHTLIEMGYIRDEDVQTGGRPTKKILVNPRAKRDKSL